MLLSRLPAGALTAAEWRHQGDGARWSRVEQLLAGVADILADGFWRAEAIWVEDTKRRPKPGPVPRPGIDSLPERRSAFLSRFASLRS